jgi:MFS family permease
MARDRARRARKGGVAMSEDGAGSQPANNDQSLVSKRSSADLLALILMFVFATGAISLSLPPVVQNDLINHVGLDNSQYGLIMTVFMAFYGISGFTSGILAARWGGRLLGVCCACFFFGSLIFGLSSNMAGFLVGRALQGLGGGMVVATCSPVLAHALPPKWLNRAWGILGAGWGIGEVIALLVMPSIENVGGYRAVFLTTAGLAFVVGIATISQKAVRTLPSHPEGATTIRGLATATASVVTNRKVLLLSFVNAAALAIGVCVLDFTPKFLQVFHGSSERTSLYLLAGLGVAQIVGNPMGAVATGRWGKYWVIVGSMIPMLVVAALVGVVPGVAATFVMVLLSGFFSMAYFPPMLSYMPEVVSKPWQVGPATGLNTALGFAGSMLFPFFFGLLLDSGGSSHRSYMFGYVMLAVFGLASVVGMAFFVSRKKVAAS